MPVQLLYFAWVRERVGLDGERVDLPPEVADVRGLVAWLAARGGGHAAAFAAPDRVRAAVDGLMAAPATPLAGAREVSLFPPVTGG